MASKSSKKNPARKHGTLKKYGPPYWSVKEAVENLKVSEPTVRRHLASGRLQRFKFGRRTLISIAQAQSMVIAEVA